MHRPNYLCEFHYDIEFQGRMHATITMILKINDAQESKKARFSVIPFYITSTKKFHCTIIDMELE